MSFHPGVKRWFAPIPNRSHCDQVEAVFGVRPMHLWDEHKPGGIPAPRDLSLPARRTVVDLASELHS
jgi:hypothetical protein